MNNVLLTKSAEVALETMHRNDRDKIEHVIANVAGKNPDFFFENSKKLTAKLKGLYVYRVNDFRIIYRLGVVENERCIEVVDIARKERIEYLSSGKK